MNRVEHLCRQYTNYIVKIARSLFDDEKLVEDVIQITYLKIAENIDKIDEIEVNTKKSYINSIIKNVARDVYKINKKEEDKIDKLKKSLEHGNITVKDKSLEDEVFLKIYLEGILDCLEEDEKKMLLLKQVYGYKNKEIAKIFNIKEKNASKKLNKIKLKLKNVIISLFSIQNQSYAGLMDIINYWIKPSEKETKIITKKETHNVIVDDFVEPTYIPDEYNDVEKDEGRRYMRITYKNNIANKTIRYTCSFIGDAGVTGLDTEDAEVEHINLDGNDVMLIYKNDMINVFFIDDIYKINILFELSDGMDFKIGKDEVIKIIKSIK